ASIVFIKWRTVSIESRTDLAMALPKSEATFQSLISGRINYVEQHCEEEIANQDCERRIYHGLSRSAADTDCAFARAQSFLATDEYNQNPEAKRFRQTHDDVAITCPAHHVRHIISAVDLEHENRDEIASSDTDGDAFGHQQRH